MGDDRRGSDRGGDGNRGGVVVNVPPPPCAICRHHGRGPSSVRYLTHGVYIWLCTAHGSGEFMRREGGGEFVQRLARVWAASGALGFKRRAALAAHIVRLRLAIEGRHKPGSHTWPELRQEAERRFAADESPTAVIDDLRRSHRGGPALVPSLRTMRRWFAQGRWLVPTARTQPRQTERPPLMAGTSSESTAATSNPTPPLE